MKKSMKLFGFFEKIVLWLLMFLIGLIIVGGIYELARQINQEMLCLDTPVVDISKFLNVLGSLLTVLIGLELLQTIKAYLHDNVLHVEMVILVAMVALARKIIVMDYSATSWHVLFGMATIIIALAGAYFIITRKKPS